MKIKTSKYACILKFSKYLRTLCLFPPHQPTQNLAMFLDNTSPCCPPKHPHVLIVNIPMFSYVALEHKTIRSAR